MTLGLSAMLLWISPVWAGSFKVDPQNSAVNFKMDNLEGFTAGALGISGGVIELNEDRSKLTALSLDVDAASINTENTLRDNTLRGSIFLDVAKFPKARFTAISIDNDKISGNLTIKDITKPVSLDYSVKNIDASSGKTVVTLEFHGVIKRTNFGIDFNRILENNKALLGDTVEIAGQLTGTLQ